MSKRQELLVPAKNEVATQKRTVSIANSFVYVIDPSLQGIDGGDLLRVGFSIRNKWIAILWYLSSFHRILAQFPRVFPEEAHFALKNVLVVRASVDSCLR